MGEKPSTGGFGGISGADDGEATRVLLGQDPLVDPTVAEPTGPKAHQLTQLAEPPPPTEVLPSSSDREVVQAHTVTAGRESHPPTEMAVHRSEAVVVPPRTVTRIVRYGPGVPVRLPENQGGRTAEHVWRGKPAPGRPHRIRRLVGSAFTVILLAASGVVIYLRFYHPALDVTGAVIAQRAPLRCGAKVTGRISTNGAAGTISYEWLFRPGGQQPAQLNQTVAAGQHVVNVIAAIEGSGHGSAAQVVTLQVLGPEKTTASTHVVVRC
jgi:hypothetical protein